MNPVNPYLGQNVHKNEAPFRSQDKNPPLQNLISGLEIVHTGLLRPNMSQGGHSVTVTLQGP